MTAATLSGRLSGLSIIAGEAGQSGGESFHGFHPIDGRSLEPAYASASPEDLERAVAAAQAAAPALANSTGTSRARLLRIIADGIDAAAETLIERAHLETALPAKPRLAGEVARTSGQLRLFAQVVEEGSWVDARIDTADPVRTPPKPDLRSMLRPLGPVAVFGASNFPLAFSVAGGDTASALAAGNPVIVKAHPAHPATSELVGHIISDSVRAAGFPAGTFSLLFDSGFSIGAALVQHPGIRAVGFTGSFRGGRALMDLATKRSVPIPVYAEMGSTNPVFILPGALDQRGPALAEGIHGSYTLGAGQFCTKPGLVFVPDSAASSENAQAFAPKLRSLAETSPAASLLTSGIASQYTRQAAAREHLKPVRGAAAATGFGAQTALYEVAFEQFASDHALGEELFGPSTLIVHSSSTQELLSAAHALEGHLTATILGTEDDLAANLELVQVLETKVGRLIFNGFPTGVEVAHAMVHGGPYPATSDGRSTSVGTQAILRFVRPVALQGMPQSVLPPELQDSNPSGILRLYNGAYTRGAAPTSEDISL